MRVPVEIAGGRFLRIVAVPVVVGLPPPSPRVMDSKREGARVSEGEVSVEYSDGGFEDSLEGAILAILEAA